MGFLNDALPIDPADMDLEEVFAVASRYEVDFADVRGQESAKRALTIAAASHHNILMIGPLGTGKTVSVGASRIIRCGSTPKTKAFLMIQDRKSGESHG